MRRVVVLLSLLALCGLASGCGGHHDKGSSALDDAVGYFSKDAPFVAAVSTDPNGPQIKQVESLVGRLPVAAILGVRLRNFSRIRNAEFTRDIKPQLGAPLVVGLLRPAAGKDIGAAVVLAMRIKHPLEAKQTILREPGFLGSSKSSGVRIYQDAPDQRYLAVDGGVLVAATDRGILEQALAMKRNDNRMHASGFQHDLEGLPRGGLISVSADLQQMIGVDARLRPALSVKWLASLRRLGAVVKASPSGFTLDFHQATNSGSLSDADLPLAPKTGAPIPLIGKAGELQVGVREPGRLARLAVAVLNAVAPSHIAKARAQEPKGIDLEQQLPRHLAAVGTAAVNLLTREFALRLALHDSAEVRTALTRLAPALPALGATFGVKGLGIATPMEGESFYALAKPNGKTAVFGVVGDSFVAASQAQRAAELSSEATHTVPGARGSAVITVDARDLVGRLLASHLSGAAALLAPLAVASLRDFTGALTINRSGLNGHFKLTIVK
ncbi:MAG: hypothetical protein QOC55_497 [Thermoleophilaceae bacterium]|nr:hypothetical protein [Thermoleophilaceae bacterium]